MILGGSYIGSCLSEEEVDVAEAVNEIKKAEQESLEKLKPVLDEVNNLLKSSHAAEVERVLQTEDEGKKEEQPMLSLQDRALQLKVLREEEEQPTPQRSELQKLLQENAQQLEGIEGALLSIISNNDSEAFRKRLHRTITRGFTMWLGMSLCHSCLQSSLTSI